MATAVARPARDLSDIAEACSAAAEADRPMPAPPSSVALLHARAPVWSEAKGLLTLDFPPGRALLASPYNHQLSTGGSADGIALVHGLLESSDDAEIFSLDFCYPLSPLLALASCLAVHAGWG